MNSSIARLKAPLPQAGQAARAEHWLWRLAEGKGSEMSFCMLGHVSTARCRGKDITADLAPTRQSFTAAAQAADREAIPVDVNVDTVPAVTACFHRGVARHMPSWDLSETWNASSGQWRLTG